jgi:transposase
MKRKVNHYTDEFKLKVIQDYISSDLGYEETKKKYGILGNSCISNWMRKFGFKSPDSKTLKLQSQMTKEADKTVKERELEQMVEKLEKQLEYEKLRNLALNTMIDVAERDLKTPIRKKLGAKR